MLQSIISDLREPKLEPYRVALLLWARWIVKSLDVPLHKTTSARHFQSKTAEMLKEGKKNHCLLGEKILIISIKERQCIHKDNISMKACTRVWGSAVQSTNQSLEWQWVAILTVTPAQESESRPHQCPHECITALPGGACRTHTHSWGRLCLHQELLTTALERNLRQFSFPFQVWAKKCIQEHAGLLRLPISFVKIHLSL